jgi:hypothetical protein
METMMVKSSIPTCVIDGISFARGKNIFRRFFGEENECPSNQGGGDCESFFVSQACLFSSLEEGTIIRLLIYSLFSLCHGKAAS